jgi:hypothetical protein
VARRMLPGSFLAARESAGPAHLERVLDDVGAAQAGDVTVYSGFTPFVGVGFDHGGWSFAVNISEGKTDLSGTRPPRPFAVEDLQERVTADIEALGIATLTIADRVYADGRRIREDEALLPDPMRRPATWIEPHALSDLLDARGEAVRQYRVVRVAAWGGELVLSIFVRFLRVERGLFTEVGYFLLPPLDESCHAVDRIRPAPDWRANLRLLFDSVVATPILWVQAPFAVAYRLLAPLRRRLRARRARLQVRADPSFDYGAAPSVRDELKSKAYRQYFQKLDREMYAKVIERQLLDSMINFLDEHDIDTSELRQRGMTVLNNGVMMSGGKFEAGTVAVGKQAKAQGGPAKPSLPIPKG